MRRLFLVVACLWGLLFLGVMAGGCPWSHGSYPPSKGECTTEDDCFAGETCSDAGACVPLPASDAGTDGGMDDGGGHAG